MVYQWKDMSFIKADPQAAGEQMALLEETGGLTPARLVEANREIGTPLHDEFEWDDEKAAKRFRETQAQYVIRHIVVESSGLSGVPVQIRAFVNLRDNEERKYLSLSRVLSDNELHQQLLEEAKSDLVAFKAKYETLEELTSVFQIIKEVTA